MVRFFQRLYPSANSVLLLGPRPVLVDTGFGSDVEALLAWLGPTAPALIVNTHFHSDHAGGNYALQTHFGTPIAASAAEAASVNRRDPDTCEARWLRQPVEAYTVQRTIAPGDEIDTGSAQWIVLATPGHTAGHVSLFCRAAGVVVLGDSLHQADIGWLSPLRPEALEATAATLDLLQSLRARVGYSGHGAAISDLSAALGRARRRIAAWREDAQQVGWHACKRIFAHMLILQDGLAEDRVADSLLEQPWFCDHALLVFKTPPAAFVAPLLAAMLRADAAFWRDGRLIARAEYRAPEAGWLRSPGAPACWVSPRRPA